MSTKDFEKVIYLGGITLIAPIGVMQKKLATSGAITTEVEEDSEDLAMTLNEMIAPGNFKPMVTTCYQLPVKSSAGEIRATNDGQIWAKAKDAWVYLTSVAGAK